jgi:two-component system nitrogen regulation response regulator GlnG
MPRLLVVDDEPSILHVFSRVFGSEEVDVIAASSGGEAIALVSDRKPDAVILDVLLPDRSGLEVFKEIRSRDAKVPIIFITAGGTSETAIEAMKLGAFDYLSKPLDFAQVRKLVARAFEIRRFMQEPVSLVSESADLPRTGEALVGRCQAMQEVYKAIGRVASQTVTVLIRGESGSGKELVARAIYHHSGRSQGPFLAVNCAAIPETLLESELFGHEKGAFTGADRRRVGKFEQCAGGTLFLDEIGDMPLALQSKILRVLQDQRFEPVGGNQTIQADVRILAATNRDLEKMVARGRFRSDLYFRLNVYTITIPPLRSRREDLPILINHFLSTANRELGRQVRGIAPEAMDLLERHTWPGNVRELQSVLKQAVLQTTGPVLLVDFLPESVRQAGRMAPHTPSPQTSASVDWDRLVDEHLGKHTGELYDEAIAITEREIITRVLGRVAGNQVQAAKALGITRTTLRAKMKQLGISLGTLIQQAAPPEEDPAGDRGDQ